MLPNNGDPHGGNVMRRPKATVGCEDIGGPQNSTEQSAGETRLQNNRNTGATL